MRLLFESGDESACPCQGHAEIIDTEEQEEAVAGRRVIVQVRFIGSLLRPNGCQTAIVLGLCLFRSMIASISMKRGAVIAHGKPRKSSLVENVG